MQNQRPSPDDANLWDEIGWLEAAATVFRGDHTALLARAPESRQQQTRSAPPSYWPRLTTAHGRSGGGDDTRRSHCRVAQADRHAEGRGGGVARRLHRRVVDAPGRELRRGGRAQDPPARRSPPHARACAESIWRPYVVETPIDYVTVRDHSYLAEPEDLEELGLNPRDYWQTGVGYVLDRRKDAMLIERLWSVRDPALR